MIASPARVIAFSAIFLLGVAWSANANTPQAPGQQAAEILEAAGIRGGLIVHLGCGDGKLTVALAAAGPYLVHGLDADATDVEQARRHIRSAGLYGKASVEAIRGARLPYTDNLVNLLLVEEPGSVSADEITRVLAPEGVALTKGDGRWTRRVKPRPKAIDEWTHFLHGPSGNAVAQDDVVGPPRHLQWLAHPRTARSHDHLGTISVVVTSGGRIFSIIDEAPAALAALPAQWKLVARDAFSGVLLWKRDVGPWEWHLRGFRSGPPEISRTLVAIGDRVYVTLAYGAAVTALDAVTGETLITYEGSEGTTEIVCHEGVLYLVAGQREPPPADDSELALWWRGVTPSAHDKRLLAIEADSGKILWKKSDAETTELMPTTLCIQGSRAFFQNPDHVVALDTQTGEVLWRADRPVNVHRLGWSSPTMVVYQDVVLSAERQLVRSAQPASEPSDRVVWEPASKGGQAPRGDLVAFDANSGRRLWSCPAQECYNAAIDVLVADGLVWTGNLVRASEPGITEGRDPRTGEVQRRRPPDKEFFQVGMGHQRCYRNKATERFLVLGRAGVEFIDVATGQGVVDHWVRGTCQHGVVPANGLLYAPSHSCACFIEAKLNGFLALAPQRKTGGVDTDLPSPAGGKGAGGEGGRTVKPALAAVPPHPAPLSPPSPASGRGDEWPTYRHDAARSGFTPTAVPARLKTGWQTDLGGKLTSPVIAGGRLFVAQVDAHTVWALDAESGKKLWSFTTGGRVDGPPTIHGPLALFGSADGHVYCVGAADGQLLWRLRAGPEDRRVVAYDQLESAWPVHGSVLLVDGDACFVAGRSLFTDGGMILYRVNPTTGEVLAQKHLDGRDPKTGLETNAGIKGTHMSGALPDVLSSDGRSIFMRHKRFDKEFSELEPTVGHLYSSVGFVDDTWWHRTYWQIGTSMRSGYGGWPVTGRQVPAGRILVLDETTVYGFGRDNFMHHGSHVGLDAAAVFHYKPASDAATRQTRFHLFSIPRPAASVEAAPAAARTRNAAARRGKEYTWSHAVPLLARAMVLADGTLFAAGPPDLLAQDDATAVWQGERGAILAAYRAEDGSELARYELEALPTFDGLAAAGGKLYLSTVDGRITCFVGAE